MGSIFIFLKIIFKSSNHRTLHIPAAAQMMMSSECICPKWKAFCRDGRYIIKARKVVASAITPTRALFETENNDIKPMVHERFVSIRQRFDMMSVTNASARAPSAV